MSANGFFNWRPCCAGVWFVLLLALPFVSRGQDVHVRSGFLYDSLKIGEQTPYYLSAHYPEKFTVLFPDSTHTFSPFEYEKKKYFPTQTTGGISADSAIYYLTTFEIARVQKLTLPVYLLQAQDCTIVQSPVDSILVTQMVAHVPDSVSAAKLPLRVNTAYQKVYYDINFWLIVIAVSALVLLAVLTWIFFGGRIRRYFRARRLRKNHLTFINTYNSFLLELQTAFSAFKTESALATWKKYMEQLEARPYTKLTTRETARLIKEPALRDDLSAIDKAIYGHDTAVVKALENLKAFADQQFSRKMKEVKHG
jgi:hypothetical protein